MKALIFTSFGLIQRRDTYLQLTALMAGQKLVTSGAGVEKHSVAPWSGWRTAEAWLPSAFLLYLTSDWQFLLARFSELLFLQKKIIQNFFQSFIYIYGVVNLLISQLLFAQSLDSYP